MGHPAIRPQRPFDECAHPVKMVSGEKRRKPPAAASPEGDAAGAVLMFFE
jgi:hypothetical protein